MTLYGSLLNEYAYCPLGKDDPLSVRHEVGYKEITTPLSDMFNMSPLSSVMIHGGYGKIKVTGYFRGYGLSWQQATIPLEGMPLERLAEISRLAIRYRPGMTSDKQLIIEVFHDQTSFISFFNHLVNIEGCYDISYYYGKDNNSFVYHVTYDTDEDMLRGSLL